MSTKIIISRSLAEELHAAAAEYPVLTILGPRQSGKTTLARMEFPDKPYRLLEAPDVRRAAELDPRGFLNELASGAILDEIQRAPHLLSYLQGIVDQSSIPGQFILTGSHQPLLHEAISQTLAGRTALLTLFPFSADELRVLNKARGEPVTLGLDAFDLIVRGMFPRLHAGKLDPERFFNGYVATYLERDVRALVNVKDLSRFQHFLILLAGRVGQVLNYTGISGDAGVSSTTIKQWISVLKASYVVFELPPYFENVGKRVIKSPKLYFTDTGLAAFLLGIRTSDQARRDPLRGRLYENLIILEILKARLNKGLRPDIYFYRDTHGNEVDLVIKEGSTVTPVEIKSAETFNEEFLKGIRKFKDIVGLGRTGKGAVLYNGRERFLVNDVVIFNPLRHEGLLSLAALREN